MSDLRYALSKLELLKRTTDGNLGEESPAAGGNEGLREKPPAAGRFFVILWKKILSYLSALDYLSHLLREI